MTDHVTSNPRLAGRVKRYHSWPTIQEQTVGERCWQVALIYERIFGELSPAVERFIRHHDTAELITGDPPFPVKSTHPAMKAAYDVLEVEAFERLKLAPPPILDKDELTRIKICDLLEMMCFGMIEREMGNMLGVPIIKRTRQAALVHVSKLSAKELDQVCRFVDAEEMRHERVIYQYELTEDKRREHVG